MQYQIQIYSPADHTADRSIVASTEGEFTQDTLKAWFTTSVEGVEIPENLEAIIVPESHAWFIAPIEELPVSGTNENMVVKKEARGFEGEQVTGDVHRVTENKRLLDERAHAIKRREEFEKMTREFQQQS
jgi:hypothetical protein